MTARLTEDRRVSEFRSLAKDFRELVSNPKSVDLVTFFARLEILLPSLCALVKSLPRIDRSPDFLDKWTHEKWQQIYKKLRDYLGKYDSYCHIYDPYDPKDKEPLIGSLADDLADICRDLSPGLDEWKNAGTDKRRAIVDEWDRNYRIHWGNHASSALRAIYWLINHYAIATDDKTFIGHKTK